MPTTFLTLTTTATPETDHPPADRLILGNPEFNTWNVKDRDGLY